MERKILEKKLTRREFLKYFITMTALSGPVLTLTQIKPKYIQESQGSAYLTLPFAKSSLFSQGFNRNYDITEGWKYSDQEQAIHGFDIHGGVDIAVPYGTPLYAPCDGFVISSYATRWLIDTQGSKKMYQGKPLRFGLGYFIQIYNPTINRFVILGHLSDIDKNIPFSPPIENNDNWIATNTTIPLEQLSTHPMVKRVKRGDPLGKVGFSGLGWGYEDYAAGAKKPVAIDPRKNKSWDEPHVHMEEFMMDLETGERHQRCIYDLYTTYESYPASSRRGRVGPNRLILLDDQGYPMFARS